MSCKCKTCERDAIVGNERVCYPYIDCPCPVTCDGKCPVTECPEYLEKKER